VLRHGGLRDAELALHDLAELARAALAAGEKLEQASADRVSQNIERVHVAIFASILI
jgi:hypothetical protein